MEELTQRIQLLEDERSILRTMYDYGHGTDRRAEDLFMDCWDEDAVLEFVYDDVTPPPGATPTRFDGRSGIAEYFRGVAAGPPMRTKHLLVEPRIWIIGDRASSESYFVVLRHQGHGPVVWAFGTYEDDLARSGDGRWRFVRRRAVIDSRPTG